MMLKNHLHRSVKNFAQKLLCPRLPNTNTSQTLARPKHTHTTWPTCCFWAWQIGTNIPELWLLPHSEHSQYEKLLAFTKGLTYNCAFDACEINIHLVTWHNKHLKYKISHQNFTFSFPYNSFKKKFFQNLERGKWSTKPKPNKATLIASTACTSNKSGN